MSGIFMSIRIIKFIFVLLICCKKFFIFCKIQQISAKDFLSAFPKNYTFLYDEIDLIFCLIQCRHSLKTFISLRHTIIISNMMYRRRPNIAEEKLTQISRFLCKRTHTFFYPGKHDIVAIFVCELVANELRLKTITLTGT